MIQFISLLSLFLYHFSFLFSLLFFIILEELSEAQYLPFPPFSARKMETWNTRKGGWPIANNFATTTTRQITRGRKKTKEISPIRGRCTVLSRTDARGVGGGGGWWWKKGRSRGGRPPPRTRSLARRARQSRSVVGGRKSCETGNRWRGRRERDGVRPGERNTGRGRKRRVAVRSNNWWTFGWKRRRRRRRRRRRTKDRSLKILAGSKETDLDLKTEEIFDCGIVYLEEKEKEGRGWVWSLHSKGLVEVRSFLSK